MALKIRLARGGSKKRPYYRLVVADSRMPRDGRYIERVGTYDPLLPKDSETRVTLLEDRIKHWISKGAKPTDRVLRFLAEAGIMERRPRNNPEKAQPGEKAVERIEQKKQKAEDAKEAAKAEKEAAKEAKKAAAEAPKEEAPAEEAPAEEAPKEEAAAEEAPKEEAAKEEKTEEKSE